MKTKITAIIIFLAIASAAMPVYYTYRSENLEKIYIEELSSKAGSLKPLTDKLNAEESPDVEKVKKLFNGIILQDPSFSALAVTDRTGRLRFMVKNDAILNSGRTVDELVKDIKNGAFNGVGEKTPAVKNYRGTDWICDRLYLFRFSSGGQSTIAVYSFTTDKMTKIRLALEGILLAAGGFIITAGVIMLLRKTGALNDTEEYRIKTIVIGEKSRRKPGSEPLLNKNESAKKESVKKNRKAYETTAVEIRESDLLPMDEPGSSGKQEPAKEGQSLILNSMIFALFKKIHARMSPESVTLYIRMTENTLSKTYELKGKSLIRIDSLTFDSISIAEIEKINKPGTYITGSGETVRIPLICDGLITGLIEISNMKSASSVNLSIDQVELTNLTREIKNYIDKNSLVTDSETGFLSTKNFVNSVNERINAAVSSGEEFSLLMINLFAGLDTDRAQRDLILKVLHPVLKKTAGPKNRVFLHKDCVSLILGNNLKEGQSIEAALVREISRFRLKISEDTIISMNPQSILRNSADSRDLKNILREVEALAAVSN